MLRLPHVLFWFAVSATLPAITRSQAPGDWRATAGVTVVAGAPCALGPDYRARFDARGVTFVPALPRVAAEQALRYELAEVRRGSERCWSRDVVPRAPEHDDRRVVYDHGDGLHEVYEARTDGLEQSFVFAHRPDGNGDLVVRGRLSTTLPLQHACARDGLGFGSDATGGITFGGVTGIDANGARIAGTVRLVGDELELALPAAFVDGAAYPLVLDPLLGAAFPIGDQPGLDRLPSVSFDATTQHWLVTWVVETSTNTSELRGQLLTAGGAPFGAPQLLVPWSVNVTEPPAVVNVNAVDRFLVVVPTRQFQTMGLYAVAVNATNGAVSNPVLIVQGSSSYQTKCAAGGDARAVGNQVLVAYTIYDSQERLKRVLVQVPAGGDPVVGFASSVSSSTGTQVFGEVAISRSAGSAGRWLLCWRNFKDVRCLAVNEVGAVCTVETTLYTAPFFNGLRDLAVATRDGTDFAVAWHETSLLAPQRLRLLPVSLVGVCPSTLSLGTAVTAVADTGGADTFAFDCARDGYLAAWTQVVGGNQQLRVRTLDPTLCVDCGQDHIVEPTATAQDEPALASRWSSGDTTSDEALLVWTDGTIRGHGVEAHGAGAVANLGGGCATAGSVPGHQGAPVLGDPTFALSLASPSAPVLGAIVGLSQVALPCGPCTLVPNLDIVMAGPGPHVLPMACDTSWLGVQFWTQWLLLAPGGCPIVPDFALSDAQRFTIGE